MWVSSVLGVAFSVEFLLRATVEIREVRMGAKFNFFSMLRCIPLVNDLVPLEVLRTEEPLMVDGFVKAHEKAHLLYHHRMKRNLARISIFLLIIFGLVVALNDLRLNAWQALLVLHFLLALLRLPYHLITWLQEYDADALAVKELHSAIAQRSLEKLAIREIPHSALFAFLYQEHPTAKMRLKQVFTKKK